MEILERYNNPSKLTKAHLSAVSSLLHGKCSTTANQLIETAKNSIGIKSEHLYFFLKQAIKRLKSIQKHIDEYNQQIKHYVDLINPLILSIPGVGYTTAGLILGELGDVKRFNNAEQIVCFAGLDVIVYESGKYKSTNLPISKKGSVYLRYALYQVAKAC